MAEDAGETIRRHAAEIARLQNEIRKKDAEIARLQAAKRRALAIADERAKESVTLRRYLLTSKLHIKSIT